jgi:rod shape determining protein RodA
MNYKSNFFDWEIILPVFLLIILGLVVMRGLVPQLLVYQLAFSILAAVVFVIFSLSDYKIFESLHIPIFIGSIIFLLIPMILGVSSRGAHRWIQLGAVSIQPSEIIKPFLLTSFAVLAALSTKTSKKLVWLGGAFLVPAAIIFLQPDLGTALVLGVGWIIVVASQVPGKLLLTGLFLVLLLSPFGWMFLREYQKDRIATFINPYNDPLGKGYHVIQSVIAVGSGGVLGRGLGQGTQSQLRFLPENHTDFIFAAISEDLGFIGGSLILGLLGVLLHRLYRLHVTTTDPVASVFCLSVMGMLAFQTFVNIGMNVGLVPVTGITLPFLSYGGSSLMSLAITLGMANSISSSGRRQVI